MGEETTTPQKGLIPSGLLAPLGWITGGDLCALTATIVKSGPIEDDRTWYLIGTLVLIAIACLVFLMFQFHKHSKDNTAAVMGSAAYISKLQNDLEEAKLSLERYKAEKEIEMNEHKAIMEDIATLKEAIQKGESPQIIELMSQNIKGATFIPPDENQQNRNV